MAKEVIAQDAVYKTVKATKTAVFEAKAPAIIGEKQPKLVENLFYSPKPSEQLCDATIVSAKGGLSAVPYYEDIFASDDAIQRPGASTTEITDLNEGKLPKDTYFLLTAIQLKFLAGVNGSSITAGSASWGLISSIIRNGTFEMQQNGRVIVPEISMEKFFNPIMWVPSGHTNTAEGTADVYTNVPKGSGIFELDNPKMLFPYEKLDVVMRFGQALTADDGLKIVLHGIKNYRVG